jgi:large subunit ribosomal protein L28
MESSSTSVAAHGSEQRPHRQIIAERRPTLAPLPSTLAMAKVCHSCGKGPAFGNSRSHSMVATRRRFDPNLQKVRIQEGPRTRRVYVCTRCLKANKVVKAA